MKTTMTLSQSLNVSPFEILDREIEDVILIINFYLELGNSKGKDEVTSSKNDGFWDF